MEGAPEKRTNQVVKNALRSRHVAAGDAGVLGGGARQPAASPAGGASVAAARQRCGDGHVVRRHARAAQGGERVHSALGVASLAQRANALGGGDEKRRLRVGSGPRGGAVAHKVVAITDRSRALGCAAAAAE